METVQAYQDDAYLSTMEATLLRLDGEDGLVFDKTNFYASGGGQPGDTGFVETSGGRQIAILDTVYASDRSAIVMRAEPGASLPAPGDTLVLHVDWIKRYKMMRMHTALQIGRAHV